MNENNVELTGGSQNDISGSNRNIDNILNKSGDELNSKYSIDKKDEDMSESESTNDLHDKLELTGRVKNFDKKIGDDAVSAMKEDSEDSETCMFEYKNDNAPDKQKKVSTSNIDIISELDSNTLNPQYWQKGRKPNWKEKNWRKNDFCDDLPSISPTSTRQINRSDSTQDFQWNFSLCGAGN